MDTNNHETWRQAHDCVGIEVSDQGRARNRWGRVLRGQVNEDGYRSVCVRVRGKAGHSNRLVHRLVLEAFVGPCPPGMETRHLNGDPGDNRLVNLSWGTPAENNQDTLRHGRHEKANRTHCPQGHPLEEGNLVGAQLRRGRRSCLACHRARGWHYYRGLSPVLDSVEFKALADGYFLDVGEEESAA